MTSQCYLRGSLSIEELESPIEGILEFVFLARKNNLTSAEDAVEIQFSSVSQIQNAMFPKVIPVVILLIMNACRYLLNCYCYYYHCYY